MSQITIDKDGGYVPTKKSMQNIDDNFDENYASIAATESDVTTAEAAITALEVGFADSLVASLVKQLPTGTRLRELLRSRPHPEILGRCGQLLSQKPDGLPSGFFISRLPLEI